MSSKKSGRYDLSMEMDNKKDYPTTPEPGGIEEPSPITPEMAEAVRNRPKLPGKSTSLSTPGPEPIDLSGHPNLTKTSQHLPDPAPMTEGKRTVFQRLAPLAEQVCEEIAAGKDFQKTNVENLALRFMYQQLKHSDTQLREDVAQAMLERGIIAVGSL